MSDFDYLMDVLENNFPFFGVVERRSGVDLREAGQELRERLEDESIELNFRTFWNMLRDDFFAHSFPIGHMWMVTAYDRQSYLNDFRTFLPNDYEENHLWQILYPLPNYAGYAELLPDIRVLNWHWSQPSHNLNFDIIEEGQTAYIRVRTMASMDESHREVVANFYEEISEFEHLIIDIRGNQGGWPYLFEEIVIEPLIRNNLTAQFHIFYKNGEHNRRFLETLAISAASFDEYTLSRLFDGSNASEYLFDDLMMLDNRLTYTRTIRAVRPRASFNGKIWMLIDDGVLSGSQWVASFVKETGFATLVGETTGGVAAFPWSSNYFSLPNTGIVIRFDYTYAVTLDGMPLEEGTQPHYFNRPGMDALETVLAMIEEMHH